MNLILSIDQQSFTQKPEKGTIGEISNRISQEKFALEDNILIDLIANQGHTWCPSIFSGSKRCANEFKSMQLFALDFDNTISYDEVIQRANSLELPVFFSYETFSSQQRNKFRLVFCHDIPVNNRQAAEIIIHMLMGIFPECDQLCKDVSRMFFGGKGLIEAPKALFSLDMLAYTFSCYLRQQKGTTHFQEDVLAFAEKHHILNKNGLLQIFLKDAHSTIGTFSPNPYIIVGDGEKFPKSYIIILEGEGKKSQPKIHKTNVISHKNIRNIKFENLNQLCKLSREFTDGSGWLYHKELFGLATNYMNIQGGKSEFLDRIDSEVNSQYSYHSRSDWKYKMGYFSKMNYKPQSCSSFCPYHHECPHAENIIQTIKTQKREVTWLSSPKYSSLEDAENDLKNTFQSVMETTDSGIHIIHAQTAIGKTQVYLQYLRNNEKPCIIALPTNRLKAEVYERLTAAGITAVCTQSVTDLNLTEKQVSIVAYYYEIGCYKEVRKYLRKVGFSTSVLAEIFSSLEVYADTQGIIVTTHQKLLRSDLSQFKDWNIIIDEDILKTIAQNSFSIKISDLQKLYQAGLPEDCQWMLERLYNVKSNHYFTQKPAAHLPYIPLEFFKESGIRSNVAAFFLADSVYVYGDYLQCFVPQGLPADLKYVVLSATANEEIYQKYFHNHDIYFHSCRKAAYKGKIIQYYNNSFSRSCLENHPKFLLKRLPELLSRPVSAVITFKRFAYYVNHRGLHFGNTEGCDFLKGSDIAVVGTPHLKEFVYKLLALHMGIDINYSLSYQEIADHGARFWFQTYSNAELRNIQLWMIGSELEQSIGRARILRENCAVHLFSNYPVEQAILTKADIKWEEENETLDNSLCPGEDLFGG